MQTVPQIMPISSMRTNHVSVLQKLAQGPVILSQRGTPAAVVVSVAEWDSTAKELQRLQRLEQIDRISAEMNADPSQRIPFTKEELFKRDLISKEQLEFLNG